MGLFFSSSLCPLFLQQQFFFFLRCCSTTSSRCNTLKIGPASEAPDPRFKLRIRPRPGSSSESGWTPLPQLPYPPPDSPCRCAANAVRQDKTGLVCLTFPHHTSLTSATHGANAQGHGPADLAPRNTIIRNHKFSGRVVKCRPAAGHARSKAFEHLSTAPIPRQHHCGGDVCCREASAFD